MHAGALVGDPVWGRSTLRLVPGGGGGRRRTAGAGIVPLVLDEDVEAPWLAPTGSRAVEC